MNFPNKVITIFATLFASTVSTTTLADEWIELGSAGIVGTTVEDAIDKSTYQYGIRINHATDNDKLYSISYNEGINLFFGEQKIKEITTGIGRRTSYQYAATTFQIGLGMTNYEDSESDSEDTNFFIPVRASLIVGKNLGASFAVSANIDDENPTLGFEFSYVLGKFN